MEKLRSVQVLRAVAATGVVVHHAYRFVDPVSAARIGAAGVDLFFVISGFIMATVAADKSPRQFVADRLWRIWPMWIIALIPWFIFRPHDLPTVLTDLTLWPIWGNVFHMPSLGVGWTLCFEVLFYGAFTLALATRPIVPLAIFAVFAVAPISHNALTHYLGSPLICEFIAGVLIARLPQRAPLGIAAILAALVLYALAPVTFYEVAMGTVAWSRVLHWGAPAALLVYGCLTLERWFAARAFNGPVLLGNASYSIYLFHTLIVLVPLPWLFRAIVAVVVGLVIHLRIERPILHLRGMIPSWSAAASKAA